MWGTSLFWLHALLSMPHFVAFFVNSLPLPNWRTCWMAPIKMHDIALGGILCDDIMSEWSKYVKFLQFNTRLLGSLRTYYFRFCFSFNCSVYDLTLIRKSHISNYYSFLQKFLLKTKTYKLVAGNWGSSIYC